MKILLSILCVSAGIAVAFGAGKDWKDYHDKWVFVVEFLFIIVLVVIGYLLR